jgi:hypothetical protein
MSGALLLALAATAAAQNFLLDQKSIGSWYRKIASPDSVEFDGVTATGILPWPHFDPARAHTPAPGEKAYTEGSLDSPGVYIGGHAEGREVDAGFKWDHRYDAQGHDTGGYGWRLFWRIAAPSGHYWANEAPGSEQDLCLRPGDTFTLTLNVLRDGTARLEARGASGPPTVVVFALDGFWDGPLRLPRRFKRVHSIDQFITDADGRRKGNEGRPAIPTSASLENGRWESVTLLGTLPAPLAGRRAVEWRGGDSAGAYDEIYGSASPDASGGEPIVVHPPRP